MLVGHGRPSLDDADTRCRILSLSWFAGKGAGGAVVRCRARWVGADNWAQGPMQTQRRNSQVPATSHRCERGNRETSMAGSVTLTRTDSPARFVGGEWLNRGGRQRPLAEMS